MSDRKPFSDAQIRAAAAAGREEFWEPNEADLAEAKRLIDAGYKSTSNKYRCLSRLPEGMTGMQALEAYAPDTHRRLLQDIERMAQCDYRRMCAREEDRTEVTPAVFRAFKKLGGGMA